MKLISIRWFCIVLSLLVVSSLAVAQDGQDGQESEEALAFVSRLAGELREQGWSSEALEELVAAATQLGWQGTEQAPAEVVALALSYSSEAEDEISGLEQAQLALELAQTAIAMQDAGLDERRVAVAALEGTRSMLAQIQQWQRGEGSEEFGLRIRSTVREAVLAQVRASAGERIPERARAALRDRFGEGFPGEPGGGGPGVPSRREL